MITALLAVGTAAVFVVFFCSITFARAMGGWWHRRYCWCHRCFARKARDFGRGMQIAAKCDGIVCQAAKIDGVICAEDQCDMEAGLIRPR